MAKLLLSLRFRLLMLVVIVISPVFGLVAYTHLEQQRLTAAEVEQEAVRLGRGVASAFEQVADDTRQLLLILTRVPEVREARKSCPVFLADLRQLYPRYANFGVTDTRGNVLCSAVPAPPGVNIADHPFLRQAIEERTFVVSGYQIGRITRRAVRVLALPVIGANGSVQAVVYAAIDLEWLNRTASEAKLPPGANVTIFSNNGTVLVRYPDSEHWIGRPAESAAMFRAALARESDGVFKSVEFDGTPTLFAVTRLRAAEREISVMLVGIPEELANSRLNKVVARNVVLLLLTGSIIGFLVWVGAHRFFLRHTDAIGKAARRLAAGEAGARTGIEEDGSELGQLASTFDHMAQALEAQRAEQRRQQERIEHANRLYAVLSGADRAIIHHRNEKQLFDEVCRITVEIGQFSMAWVGMIDDEGIVRCIAHHGLHRASLSKLQISVRHGEWSGGTTATALREGKPRIVSDILSDPEMTSLRDRVASCGYRSSVAFPLRLAGRVVGSYSVYAAEPAFFDDKEVFELLEKLSRDMSFALDSIEHERRRYEAEARVEYLANYDALTGLPNRALFVDRLQQLTIEASRHQCTIAVLFLDIDRFKGVNEMLGLDAGDALLKAVAERLVRSVRPGDTVARAGGDGFGIIFADLVRAEDVGALAQHIMDSFAQPFEVAERDLFATASIGISVFPADSGSPERLVSNADIAMYRAKEQGGNRFEFYAPEMTVKVNQRMALEHQLRYAIERGELLLHYQPQIEIGSGRIAGAEALIRWRHPELGMVSPTQFIPLAEETGLIAPIGEWVLRSACAQAKAWQDAGHEHIGVSVNLSPRQLQDKKLVSIVSDILAQTGLESRYLTLEITENVIVHSAASTMAILCDLNEMGVALSIDDFGTGYSSLSYLRRFPISTLKIEKSFMRDIPGDNEAAAIVGAIIAMARSLKMNVIAEGVEKPEQVAYLTAHGCDQMQGFLCSRPVAPSDFAALLTTGCRKFDRAQASD